MPVCLSHEVLGVVSEHIGKLAAVVASESWVDLICVKGLLEVDGDLSSDLGKNTSGHTCITSLLEEEVLGLGEA